MAIYPAAFYYPHTNIKDQNLIKNSLLLWDQVEYITPTVKWKHEQFSSKLLNEAIELISKPHFPSDAERLEAHNRISKIVSGGLPDWFFLNATRRIRNFEPYFVYPEKFNDATWHLLKESNLATYDKQSSDRGLTPYFGLMIMSILADACAGKTKRKITDRAEAYFWLQKYATAEAGGEIVSGLDASQVAPSYERLVTLSIKVLQTDDIPISTLVAMRKREVKSSSSDYRNFRINYLKRIDACISDITQPGLTQADVIEIERQFQKDMKSDLTDLKKELQVNRDKLLFSKEVLVAATAGANALSTPIRGLTDLSVLLGSISVGALIKAGKEYNAARRKALKSSAMSWLYLADKKASNFNPRKVIF